MIALLALTAISDSTALLALIRAVMLKELAVGVLHKKQADYSG